MSFIKNILPGIWKRLFDPDEWMIRLLGLSAETQNPSLSGALVIQVDGLGREDFRKAMNRGDMPHLKKLLKSGEYTERSHYSGQPSCTPAVQGGLFYGVKSCVPAFSFRDKKTGRVFNMFSPSNAAEIEKRMEKRGKALLKGGSSYGNIFTGGASEAHFCIASVGFRALFKNAKPFALVIFTFMHLHIIARAAVLTAVEFVLGVYDTIRGFFSGRNLFDEIAYIPLRVIVCIIMRELAETGARIDIARGVPVIHVNLAGYDEQAHHRGPGSKFARWTLKSIDNVIRVLCRSAKAASRRSYQVFVYSDHGQEETTGYAAEFGRPMEEAINEVLSGEDVSAEFHMHGSYLSADVLTGRPVNRARAVKKGGAETAKRVVITALGPVGHVYPGKKISMKQKEKLANLLVVFAEIPLVIISSGKNRAIAWNDEGRFVLPRDAAKVLGDKHPFAAETARDLVKLCSHENSGEIIVSGLRKKGRSITFFNERGSHGGPGPNETEGFAVIPRGAALGGKGGICTAQMRRAVFGVLKKSFAAAGA